MRTAACRYGGPEPEAPVYSGISVGSDVRGDPAISRTRYPGAMSIWARGPGRGRAKAARRCARRAAPRSSVGCPISVTELSATEQRILAGRGKVQLAGSRMTETGWWTRGWWTRPPGPAERSPGGLFAGDRARLRRRAAQGDKGVYPLAGIFWLIAIFCIQCEPYHGCPAATVFRWQISTPLNGPFEEDGILPIR